jgi:hypothetical protein
MMEIPYVLKRRMRLVLLSVFYHQLHKMIFFKSHSYYRKSRRVPTWQFPAARIISSPNVSEKQLLWHFFSQTLNLCVMFCYSKFKFINSYRFYTQRVVTTNIKYFLLIIPYIFFCPVSTTVCVNLWYDNPFLRAEIWEIFPSLLWY